MKKYLIPEDARDRLRACVAKEDTDKFATCKEISRQWFELGPGIIYEKSKEEGWKPKEARGKAHRWFLASQAADSGLGYQSMLNRQRVGDSWIARGYHGGENENISYQKVVCLHVNAEKGSDGLIRKEVLEERIAWFHNVADENFGQPPSVLDIQKNFRRNGDKPEWLLLWKKIIRIAKQMLKLEDVPKEVQAITKSLLSIVIADSSGGTEKENKSAGADTNRKFEVPTIIYKDKSGYTNAQRSER